MLGALAIQCSFSGETPASVASQPVGLFQIPINPGANLISVPLHRIHSYRGVVGASVINGLTLAPNPSWAADQFAPKDGFTQFIVIVRKSASGNPVHVGDWWPVLANSGNGLTVDSRGEDLRTAVQAGDQVEVRHLMSLKDVFGTGATFALNKDSDGTPSANQEDLIRFVKGTGFSSTIFYHDGTAVGEGYYGQGLGPLDGSTITLWPDQPLMVFRKAGSASVNLSCRGQVQVTPLAHYLQPGAAVIGNPFPVNAPIGTSGLLEAGWVKDVDGVPSTTQEDLLRPVVGTGLSAPVFYHDGAGVHGWYANGVLNNEFPLEPSKGYMLFLKGTDAFVWTQPPPFTF